MKHVLALRALQAELYNQLPKSFLILNFCFSSFEYYDKDNVVNIDMHDYGIMNPSYILLRKKALVQVIEDNINRDDILLLYVKDLKQCDGFLNITNTDYFLADFMYKRKYLNYYLYQVPTIFENNDNLDNYLKVIEKYGNVIPINVLRNFLIRNSETTNHMIVGNVITAILDIVNEHEIKSLKRVRKINELKSNAN